MESANCAIIKYFNDIKDPRIDRKKQHKLIDIIIIALCGVMCGADGWEEIEEIGNASLDKFKGFLELPHGIPSHDTIARVFSRLDPEGLQSCFCRWIQSVREQIGADSVVASGHCCVDAFAGRSYPNKGYFYRAAILFRRLIFVIISFLLPASVKLKTTLPLCRRL